jgi:hypothetical protein
MFRRVSLIVVVLALASPGRAEDKKPAKSIDDDGFIRVWLLLAPIPLAEGESQADSLDKEKVKDEAKLEPKDGDKVKVGEKELMWKKQVSEDYFFDLNKHVGEVKEQAVGFAATYIVADAEKKDVTLKIGSDDGCKIWLNGKEIGKVPDDRPLEKDQNAYEKLTLKKGTNVLLFKVGNGIADWTGCARFMDASDKPVAGLTADVKKP